MHFITGSEPAGNRPLRDTSFDPVFAPWPHVVTVLVAPPAATYPLAIVLQLYHQVGNTLTCPFLEHRKHSPQKDSSTYRSIRHFPLHHLSICLSSITPSSIRRPPKTQSTLICNRGNSSGPPFSWTISLPVPYAVAPTTLSANWNVYVYLPINRNSDNSISSTV